MILWSFIVVSLPLLIVLKTKRLGASSPREVMPPNRRGPRAECHLGLPATRRCVLMSFRRSRDKPPSPRIVLTFRLFVPRGPRGFGDMSRSPSSNLEPCPRLVLSLQHFGIDPLRHRIDPGAAVLARRHERNDGAGEGLPRIVGTTFGHRQRTEGSLIPRRQGDQVFCSLGGMVLCLRRVGELNHSVSSGMCGCSDSVTYRSTS